MLMDSNLPREDLFIGLWTNRSLDNTDVLTLHAAKRLFGRSDRYYPQLATELAEAYVGTYKMIAPDSNRTVDARLVEGNLVLFFRGGGGQEVNVYSEAPDRFVYPDLGIEITFNRDGADRVIGFTAVQGETVEWVRVE